VPRRLIDGLTCWPTWSCYFVVSKTSLNKRGFSLAF
jgi:hypothetical protein